ncbi:MAG: hypothetical protein QGG71_19190 [Pirellulaceae bacterium]|nr:hypothetical protein [Pirellulaceae bacterium]
MSHRPWTMRERPSSEVAANDRHLPTPQSDPRTVAAAALERLERPRLQSSIADQALADLTDYDFL